LERGLQADPLWHDPKVAAWWCWGQCAWIGGGWCAGLSHRRGLSPNVLPRGITCRPETNGRGEAIGRTGSAHRKRRQGEVSGGDWARVVTPCVLGDKPCAVFLDPPYKAHGGMCYGRYNDGAISARVRLWAVQNGENPNMRIALCEYEGVFDMPPHWSCYRW